MFEVLDSIQKRSGDTPEPFAISKQYKGNNKTDVDEKNEVIPPKSKKAPKSKVAKKRKVCKPVQTSEASSIEYEPSVYKELRQAYIDNLRETGVAFNLAATAWNLSQEKRKLLCNVSVSELKRRRFLPKGATENPWAM